MIVCLYTMRSMYPSQSLSTWRAILFRNSCHEAATFMSIPRPLGRAYAHANVRRLSAGRSTGSVRERLAAQSMGLLLRYGWKFCGRAVRLLLPELHKEPSHTHKDIGHVKLEETEAREFLRYLVQFH